MSATHTAEVRPARGASKRTAAVHVVALTLFHIRVPLKRKITHASHSRSDSENVVVACRLSDGSVGFGEGVPRDYVTGEDIHTSLQLLRDADWSGQLEPVGSFRDAVALVRRFHTPPVRGDDRDCVGNAARCAAELALLDAYGRSFGVCLSTLPEYSDDWTSIYKPRRYCRYSGAITSKPSLKREIWSALKMWANTFKDVKIKVGTAGQDDVRRLKVFRRILRWHNFRIDANEAWSPAEAVTRIQELEPFGITAVEQPVAHEDIACLAEVRQQVKTPIMLDESLCSMADAQRAVREGLCDLFNIRLSKCGGLTRSLDLAAYAKQHNLGYQLGCQVGETGILSAAGRHFALSVRDIRYLEGSYDHHLVKEWLTQENLTFEWMGYAGRLPRPGLGVTIEPERLQRVTVTEETIRL